MRLRPHRARIGDKMLSDLILLGEQRHTGVRNLPEFLRRVPGRDSNPRPLDHKSDTLPTVPRRCAADLFQQVMEHLEIGFLLNHLS